MSLARRMRRKKEVAELRAAVKELRDMTPEQRWHQLDPDMQAQAIRLAEEAAADPSHPRHESAVRSLAGMREWQAKAAAEDSAREQAGTDATPGSLAAN